MNFFALAAGDLEEASLNLYVSECVLNDSPSFFLNENQSNLKVAFLLGSVR